MTYSWASSIYIYISYIYLDHRVSKDEMEFKRSVQHLKIFMTNFLVAVIKNGGEHLDAMLSHSEMVCK